MAGKKYTPRVKTAFNKKDAVEIKKERNCKSTMQVTRVAKISVSMGVCDGITNKKLS